MENNSTIVPEANIGNPKTDGWPLAMKHKLQVLSMVDT